jgi:hypothetical protein
MLFVVIKLKWGKLEKYVASTNVKSNIYKILSEVPIEKDLTVDSKVILKLVINK